MTMVDDDFSNVVRADAYRARNLGIGSIDEDPERGAESLRLSALTGVPAPAIHADFDEFKAAEKRRSTADLLAQSPALQDYINSHPLAATVSNDDLGHLDKAGSTLRAFRENKLLNLPQDMISAAGRGFVEGFGEQAVGSWMKKDGITADPKEDPVTWGLLSTLGMPVEVGFRALGGAIKGATEAAVEGVRGAGPTLGLDALSQATGGAIGNTESLARDVGGIAEQLTTEPMHAAHVAAKPDLFARSQLTLAVERARPYLERGEEPPTGLHPIIDSIKAEQAKLDAENLREMEREALASTTRERAPDFYANFARQQTDIELGLNAEAVRKLYGDKPLDGEGPLAHVTNLKEQVELSEAYGGDVIVPLPDWLAHTDPEVMKELRDNIRVGRRGLTLEEAKEVGKAEAPVQPSIDGFDEQVGAVRQMMQVGPLEKKLQLQRKVLTDQEAMKTSEFGPAQGFHDFEMFDQEGKKVGFINISEQKEGKGLYVDMVSGAKGYGPADFGPKLMRDVLRQLKEHFPDAEWIEGDRISGARHEAGKQATMARVPLHRMNIGDANLREFFNQWYDNAVNPTHIGDGVYVSELRPVEADRKLIQNVTNLLHTIVPNLDARAVGSMASETFGSIGGLYSTFTKAKPVLRWALDADNPIATARHEAIHHLRNEGFFTREEWGTLERAARQGKWAEKHNVEELYKEAGLDRAAVLEEAIAEEFGHWVRGEDTSPAVVGVFEKLKALFAQIKEAFQRLFGDAKADDIFKQVEEGIIGKREPGGALGEAGQKMGQEPKQTEAHIVNVPTLSYGRLSEDNPKKQLEVLVNPSVSELTRLAKEADDRLGPEPRGSIRAMRDTDGNVYAWKAKEATHVQVQLSTEWRQKDFRDNLHWGLEEGRLSKEAIEVINSGRQKMQIEGEKPPFATASAFGSTERNAQRYAQLINKRNAEDFEKALKRAEKKAAAEQTPEWKANYAAMKDETTAQIDARPDVAALNALNDKVWLGKRMLDEPLKLDPDLIPADLREQLPKQWTAKDGMQPDAMAQMLGYPDGRSMLEATLRVEAARKEEGLSYAKWRERQIKTETDRRMEAAHGDLKSNIADAAQEQALSATQMELLHEETLALALKANAEFSITKDQMQRMAADHFEAQPAKGLKPEQFLTAAGRAGRKVEDALLAGKPLEAFKAKQQQFIATVMAKEAAGWKKEQAKLDTLIKRLSPHHVESMDTSYANYAQELLSKAGVPIRRAPADIQLGIAHEGHGSFGEFLAANFREGGELYATPEMQQGLSKPYEQMTVGERRDFDRALRSLWTEGRSTQKLIVAGDRHDLAEVRAEIRDNIRSLPLQKGASPVRDWVYGFDAMTAKPEEMLKDLDLRKDMGPLFKYVMVPMADAKAHKFSMLKELSDSLKKISEGFKGDWRKTLEDSIPQTLLVDPADGVAFDMKRENLIQIMMNWGTESSRNKFADGWGRGTGTAKLTKEQRDAFKTQIKDLIDQHATAADWDYVQKVWDVFAHWKPLTDTVYRNLSGTAPKWIPNEALETAHGTVEGKYFPVIYDSYYGNIDAKRSVAPSVGQFPTDYYRSTTSNGHTIERTGYTDNVQFMRPLETVASRMQQTIHDIAFREAVINTNKILFDPQITNAITRHYGKPYRDNLQAWVGRVANETNLNERELAAGYAVLRQFRLNLIGHALPFNLNVLLSPDVGTANPKALTNFLMNRKDNMEFVMENSKEVQHMVYSMDRDFREALTATIGKEDQLSQVRKFMIEKGFGWITKLSQQLRAASWLHEYNAQRAKGFSHYEAAQLGDSVVRERHGGASVVDLPSIMASNEAMKTFTMFYGYFNTMQNWMRQVPGNVRRGEWEKAAATLWGTVGVGAIMNAALFNKQAENDSWFKIVSKAVSMQVIQGLPLARDAASYAFEGFTARSASLSATVAVKALIDDAFNAWNKKPVKKPVQHTLNALGLTTGLPMAQFGRTGEFAYDVATKQQHPRNIIEWMRGIRTGEARLPKK